MIFVYHELACDTSKSMAAGWGEYSIRSKTANGLVHAATTLQHFPGCGT